MERYNPQSIEKQAADWPVLFSQNQFDEDIQHGVAVIHGKSPFCLYKPVIKQEDFQLGYAEEYGIDACRISSIMSDPHCPPMDLLDPAYRFLSKLYKSCFIDSVDQFDPKPWLRAIAQSYDHVILRNKPSVALAMVFHAFAVSAPGKNINKNYLKIVFSAVYPYAPILSQYAASFYGVEIRPLDELLNNSKCVAVSFRVGKGGWHREIFEKTKFDEDPVEQFKSLKWVKKAAGKNPIKIKYSGSGDQRRAELVFACQ